MDLSQALRVTRRLEMLTVHSNGLIVVVIVVLAPLSLAPHPTMILNDVAAEGSSPYRLKRGTKASVRSSSTPLV